MFTDMATGRRSPTTGNIVDKLFSRQISGRETGILIHQHYQKSLHLTYTSLYSKFCVERKFVYSTELNRLIRDLKKSPRPGVCRCLWYGKNKSLPWRFNRLYFHYDHWWLNTCYENLVGDPCSCIDRSADDYIVPGLRRLFTMCRKKKVTEEFIYYDGTIDHYYYL
jgi:hypothetical protein